MYFAKTMAAYRQLRKISFSYVVLFFVYSGVLFSPTIGSQPGEADHFGVPMI